MREARITVEPKRSPSSSMGSPAFRPTRTFSGSAECRCSRRGAVGRSTPRTAPIPERRPYAPIVPVKRSLQRYRALHGFRHRAERSHEPVAHRLYFRATVRLQHLAGDAFVLAQHVAALLVAEALHHLGVPDDVR